MRETAGIETVQVQASQEAPQQVSTMLEDHDEVEYGQGLANNVGEVVEETQFDDIELVTQVHQASMGSVVEETQYVDYELETQDFSLNNIAGRERAENSGIIAQKAPQETITIFSRPVLPSVDDHQGFKFAARARRETPAVRPTKNLEKKRMDSSNPPVVEHRACPVGISESQPARPAPEHTTSAYVAAPAPQAVDSTSSADHKISITERDHNHSTKETGTAIDVLLPLLVGNAQKSVGEQDWSEIIEQVSLLQETPLKSLPSASNKQLNRRNSRGRKGLRMPFPEVANTQENQHRRAKKLSASKGQSSPRMATSNTVTAEGKLHATHDIAPESVATSKNMIPCHHDANVQLQQLKVVNNFTVTTAGTAFGIVGNIDIVPSLDVERQTFDATQEVVDIELSNVHHALVPAQLVDHLDRQDAVEQEPQHEVSQPLLDPGKPRNAVDSFSAYGPNQQLAYTNTSIPPAPVAANSARSQSQRSNHAKNTSRPVSRSSVQGSEINFPPMNHASKVHKQRKPNKQSSPDSHQQKRSSTPVATDLVQFFNHGGNIARDYEARLARYATQEEELEKCRLVIQSQLEELQSKCSIIKVQEEEVLRLSGSLAHIEKLRTDNEAMNKKIQALKGKSKSYANHINGVVNAQHWLKKEVKRFDDILVAAKSEEQQREKETTEKFDAILKESRQILDEARNVLQHNAKSINALKDVKMLSGKVQEVEAKVHEVESLRVEDKVRYEEVGLRYAEEKTRCENLETHNAMEKVRMQKLEAEYAKEKFRVQELEAEQVHVRALEVQHTEEKARIQELEAEYAKDRLRVQELEAQHGRDNARIQELEVEQGRNQELEARHAKERLRSQELEAQHGKEKARVQELEAEHAKERLHVQELEAQHGKEKARLQELEKQCIEETTRNEEAQARHESSIEELKTENSTLREKLDKAKENNRVNERILHDREADLERSLGQNEVLTKHHAERWEHFEKLIAQVPSNTSTALNSCDGPLAQLIGTDNTIKQKVEEIKSTISRLSEQACKVPSTLVKLMESVSSRLESQKQPAGISEDAFKEAVTMPLQQLQETLSQLQQEKDAEPSLHARIIELERALASLNTKQSDHDTRVEDLSSQLQDSKQELSRCREELKQRTTELQAALNIPKADPRLPTQISDLQASKERLGVQAMEANEEVLRVKEELASVREAVEQKETDLKALSRKLSLAEQENEKATETRNGELARKDKEHLRKYQDLAKNAESQKATIRMKLDSEIKSLELRVAEKITEVTSLNETLRRVQAEADRNAADLESNRARLQAQEGLQSEIFAYKQQTVQLVSQVKCLEQAKGADQDMTALSTQLKTIQAELSDLHRLAQSENFAMMQSLKAASEARKYLEENIYMIDEGERRAQKHTVQQRMDRLQVTTDLSQTPQHGQTFVQKSVVRSETSSASINSRAVNNFPQLLTFNNASTASPSDPQDLYSSNQARMHSSGPASSPLTDYDPMFGDLDELNDNLHEMQQHEDDRMNFSAPISTKKTMNIDEKSQCLGGAQGGINHLASRDKPHRNPSKAEESFRRRNSKPPKSALKKSAHHNNIASKSGLPAGASSDNDDLTDTPNPQIMGPPPSKQGPMRAIPGLVYGRSASSTAFSPFLTPSMQSIQSTSTSSNFFTPPSPHHMPPPRRNKSKRGPSTSLESPNPKEPRLTLPSRYPRDAVIPDSQEDS